MSSGLVVAVVMALLFAFTNGVHDAANAIATLVATRAARPGTAVLLAAAGNVVGPLVLGSAVANTIAGIVTVPTNEVIPVLGAALTGAVAWNAITWWRGLPSSSGHALLGGLVGAALAEGGTGSVDWGGFDGIKPVGVIGVAVVLTIAPVLGFVAGLVVDRGAATRRAAEHPARARARARRAMGDVRGSRAQPRRERRAEGRRCGRARCWSPAASCTSSSRRHGSSSRAARTHGGNRARRLADRADASGSASSGSVRSTRSRARPVRPRSCSARRCSARP